MWFPELSGKAIGLRLGIASCQIPGAAGRKPIPRLPALLLPVLLFANVVHAEVGVGDPFPVLTAAGLEGDPLPATNGRVVLVDFWASWCAPCKASFPAYARLYADDARRGLLIVAVSVDEHPAAYAAFLKDLRPPFATARDSAHRLVREVNVPAMPSCYLVGRDGRVRFRHRGFHGESTENDLRKEIDLLLAEPSPSP